MTLQNSHAERLAERPKIVKLNRVKRSLVSVLLVGLVAAATGCGKSATPEPAAPSREATQTRPQRPRQERPLPKLIAPPPAYGNRVVMARGPSTTSQN